jgi:enoyl-CoA hydratase/carnithine racemase
VLRIQTEGRVRTVTLDRPQALNAMSNELYNATADAFRDAAADPGIAVVVLTGNGRAFCAGQDLGEMATAGQGATAGASAAAAVGPGAGSGHGFAAFTDGLIHFPKPVIAAVNGLAVGVGFTMLAHCDLVLVADTARLRAPFTTLGVCPEAASSATFPVVMGQQTAAYYLYTAEWMSAEQAVASGLAWKVVPAADLLAEAAALAATIAAKPIPSLVATKELMVASRIDAVVAARAREDQAFRALIGGPANREAVAAFLEKRDPDFTQL